MVTHLDPDVSSRRSERRNAAKISANADELPHVSSFLAWGFKRYTRRYLRRHFNAVRLAVGTQPILPPDRPVICFANHPSWWDPLVAFFLNEQFFDGRTIYTPIDARALQQYPVFRKLGFYGIDLESRRGARRFLRVTTQLLSSPRAAIWMTPGGSFIDVRQRTTFRPGLAHVVAHHPDAMVIPLALEYTFWEERTAEVLVEFGSTIDPTQESLSKEQWHERLESSLAKTQADLASKAMRRDDRLFQALTIGNAGVGGVYDVMRRARAFLRGESFHRRHREVTSEPRS